ncbi:MULTISPECIES: DsrE/DsrF/TusD sulfur relay family protein [Actinomadura]|uniref:DsrE/DsrF-like family protein n=1 Tax=Actinomadura litoris TaxID=2678616 RepID=A0A7K1LE29_9ACTN|nr:MULTISPECIES: DsrE family protein [Actinomadura]MBT2212765.1 DsrE family protein [Actinomadura sp. NEAU-AAG7]MUN42677.1 hypothetical protein [Actinomadura litoris]
MRILFVLHDPPYGTERTYNGLRWAAQMMTTGASNEVRVFLFGDAVASVQDGQSTPNGFYNVGRMVQGLVEHGASVGSCGTCLDARGIDEKRLVKGCHRSSMKELAAWTEWADKAINI